MCISCGLGYAMKRRRVMEKEWGLTVFTYLNQVVSLIQFFYLSWKETRRFTPKSLSFLSFPVLWFNRKTGQYFLLLTFTKSLLFSFIIIVLIIVGSHDRSLWFFSFIRLLPLMLHSHCIFLELAGHCMCPCSKIFTNWLSIRFVFLAYERPPSSYAFFQPISNFSFQTVVSAELGMQQTGGLVWFLCLMAYQPSWVI